MMRQLKRRQWLMVGAAIMAVFAAGAACGGGSASKRADSSAGGTGQTQLKASSGGQPVEQAVNGAVRDPGKVQSGVDGDPGANTDALRGAPNDATGGGANPLALPSQLDRKIIMTATLDLSADEVSKRFEDIGNIATSAGGFIASSTFGNANDRQTASVTIRVPKFLACCRINSINSGPLMPCLECGAMFCRTAGGIALSRYDSTFPAGKPA